MRSLQIHPSLDNNNIIPENSPGIQPVKKCSSQCFKVLDFVLNDLVMVIFSFVDIVLDVLVCRQFFIDGEMEFFYASLSIFIFARK